MQETGLNRSSSYKKLTVVSVLAFLAPQLSYADMCAKIYAPSPLTTALYERAEPEARVDLTSFRSIISANKASERMGVVGMKFDNNLDTRVFYTRTAKVDPKTGRIPMIDPTAKAVFVFIHGSGTMQSGGNNFIANMNFLASHGHAAISVDLPFHAGGPIRDAYRNADYFMRWVDRVVDIATQSGKPVYLVGHSFGPDVIAEYMYRYPRRVDGGLLMSPASFNKTLEQWYEQYTTRMRFGGEVPANRIAGEWSYEVSRGFQWSKSEGRGDPTIANPDLQVRILSGNREEYVPAPVGGSNRTPIGNNTYDIAAALKKFFREATITVEDGIGHYLFDFKDKNGLNVVAREILSLVGESPANSKEIVRDIGAQRENSKSMAEAIAQRFETDMIFRQWVIENYGEATVLRMLRQDNNSIAKKMQDEYVLWKKDVDQQINQAILNTQETHPAFYQQYQRQIEQMRKTGDTTLHNPFLDNVLSRD